MLLPLMSQTAPSIHGHDVLFLIHDQEQYEPFTRESLRTAVERQVGPDPRFHTCSAQGMTLDQLLEFLLARGKVVERGGRLHTMIEKVCGHGDHDHTHDHEAD